MQHLDEGTIHAWLDGALSPDEAARAEAHVAECPQCAAAVAEARGFIAASSRILTALDNAPRGVMPAATPKRRIDPLVWRVAATVLVVAAGTLVVVRNYGPNEPPTSASASFGRDVLSRRTSVADQSGTTTAPAAAAPIGVPENRARQIEFSSKSKTPSSRSDTTITMSKALGSGVTVGIARSASTPEIAATAAPTVLRLRGVTTGAAMDAASESEPLRQIGTPARSGAKVVLYEVAPGDTVTLTELLATDLKQNAVTGGAGSAMALQAAAKSAAASSRAQAAAPAPQTMANAEHTITWTDSATGNTLTLSGRMPEARLQEIRIRIERERAAAKRKP